MKITGYDFSNILLGKLSEMANATLRYQDLQDLRMNRIKTDILSPITSFN
ncbi:MAG: hypothetical protein HEQ31_00420 [Dolichospermum sp. OL03]|nr:hypothetical protein [Dolichospermum sp. OL03]